MTFITQEFLNKKIIQSKVYAESLVFMDDLGADMNEESFSGDIVLSADAFKILLERSGVNPNPFVRLIYFGQGHLLLSDEQINEALRDAHESLRLTIVKYYELTDSHRERVIMHEKSFDVLVNFFLKNRDFLFTSQIEDIHTRQDPNARLALFVSGFAVRPTDYFEAFNSWHNDFLNQLEANKLKAVIKIDTCSLSEANNTNKNVL